MADIRGVPLGTCTRNDLAARAGISASAISWHMKKLAEEGIVVREKEGREMKYRLSEGVGDLFNP
ncbi:MAG: winged helix-turn-helix transcriptional regulator [Methanolinea sp.]|nr:winged helix-turn-helix transcriptional regulator [Methanolinea sp.]